MLLEDSVSAEEVLLHGITERDRSHRARSFKAVGQLREGPSPHRAGMETRRCPLSPTIFVGMDISSHRVDVAVRPGIAFHVANDELRIAAAVERLQRIQPHLDCAGSDERAQSAAGGNARVAANYRLSSSFLGRCRTSPECSGEISGMSENSIAYR